MNEKLVKGSRIGEINSGLVVRMGVAAKSEKRRKFSIVQVSNEGIFTGRRCGRTSINYTRVLRG